jgi:hypothetical protein
VVADDASLILRKDKSRTARIQNSNHVQGHEMIDDD